MKVLLVLLLAMSLVNCDSGGGFGDGGTFEDPPATTPPTASPPPIGQPPAHEDPEPNDPAREHFIQADIAYYQSDDQLPPCATATDGKLIYIVATNDFRACSDGQWTVVSIKGDQGQKGSQGEQGEKGEEGEKGAQGDRGDKGDPGIVVSDLAQSARSIWQQYVLSTAFIQVNYGALGSVSGSGFVVAPGIVATNGHVVIESRSGFEISSIKIWYPETTSGDTRYDERPTEYVIGTAVDRSIADSDDIALVQVPTGNRTPVTLNDLDEAPDHLDPTLGTVLAESVLLMGYSSGSTYAHFTTGQINAIQPVTQNFLNGFLDSGRLVYEYDLVSGGGSSGGAVFNMDGDVIGVNFAGNTASADTEFGYAVQVKHLRSLIAAPRNWATYQLQETDPGNTDPPLIEPNG